MNSGGGSLTFHLVKSVALFLGEWSGGPPMDEMDLRADGLQPRRSRLDWLSAWHERERAHDDVFMIRLA